MSRNQAAAQAPERAKWKLRVGDANTYPWARGAGGARQPYAALGTRQALQRQQPHQRVDSMLPWHGQDLGCPRRNGGAGQLWGGQMVCRGLVGKGRVLTRMPEPGSPGSPCGESLHQSHHPDPRPPRS